MLDFYKQQVALLDSELQDAAGARNPTQSEFSYSAEVQKLRDQKELGDAILKARRKLETVAKARRSTQTKLEQAVVQNAKKVANLEELITSQQARVFSRCEQISQQEKRVQEIIQTDLQLKQRQESAPEQMPFSRARDAGDSSVVPSNSAYMPSGIHKSVGADRQQLYEINQVHGTQHLQNRGHLKEAKLLVTTHLRGPEHTPEAKAAEGGPRPTSAREEDKPSFDLRQIDSGTSDTDQEVGDQEVSDE